MATMYVINITNASSTFQNFFVFQKPAVYIGGQSVYANSLWTRGILPSSQGGSSATFMMLQQYYAGVQEQIVPPAVGVISGYSSAVRAIGLTPGTGGTPTNNSTSMIISPALGLTPPVIGAGVQPGAFRIITAQFNPTVTPFNAGLASTSASGSVTLSNFISALPNQNIDCQPILQFYVQTGVYTAGTVINFTSSSTNAAVCDATTGFVTFNVTYNVDGTWSVTPFARTLLMGQPRIHAASDIQPQHQIECKSTDAPSVNAEIKNEAGRAVICTGNASNFYAPVTIQNLNHPNAITLHNEYQVGPSGGPYVGRMCTHLGTDSATFS